LQRDDRIYVLGAAERVIALATLESPGRPAGVSRRARRGRGITGRPSRTIGASPKRSPDKRGPDA
jgi:hypothetical protein